MGCGIMGTVGKVIAVAVLYGAFSAGAKPKPNIVHIMVDDLGWQDIASHKLDGNPVYETPHLDRMTREGRRFTQAYSPAPSCAPSRVAFLRGQHPVNTEVYHVSGGRIPRAWHKNSDRICPYYSYGLPVEEPMIPEALTRAGYITAHVGKWHAGGKSAGYPFPLDQGFDFGFTERDGRHKYYNDEDLWNPEEQNRNTFFGAWASPGMEKRLSVFATDDPNDPYQVNEKGRPFDKPLDLVLGFMEKYKGQPFFMNYCPYEVHGPIQTRDKKRFDNYVNKLGMEYPTDPKKTYYDLPGHSDPYYASMVDTVDYYIGQVISYLEQTDDPRNPGHKLIDNTYVIVDSDNGGVHRFTDNAPLKGGKQNTWEGGVRIPFLVRGPGVQAGSICDTPINLIDLFPTFMTMAGLPRDEALELDGCDILPLIHGESDTAFYADGRERESLFWFFPWDAHMSSALRKGPWKLVRHYGAAKRKPDVRLFRLYAGERTDDLSEARDVGDQFPEVRRGLLEELDQLIAVAGAPVPFDNPTAKNADQAAVAAMPNVLDLGSEEDRVWVMLESGNGKAEIENARLLYTLNPPPMDTIGGNREEWLSAPATISQGRVEAVMPPGATHAVFSMVDANGFLISSEAMPAVCDVGHHAKDSELLANGFAYKPGLYALIKLGEQAFATTGDKELKAVLKAAKAKYAAEQIDKKIMCDAIRSLRTAIRSQQGTPEAAHPLLNRFPTEPLF
ncbi:Arylsulfatase [Pontiella desulfatans]|uniref:Arylsulfatase n=1 Tax=Pontiella desulfatans TaxID=2750659 RepID=A0A6C2UC66_PONDE|nr:sulfatase [Pontiella desulfatans]SPS74098.1 sulfatase S1_16 [Kiritimatiellales bacterium]VGO17700.1 Arylsulfatase [Pontiella desulfatans]